MLVLKHHGTGVRIPPPPLVPLLLAGGIRTLKGSGKRIFPDRRGDRNERQRVTPKGQSPYGNLLSKFGF